MTAKCRRAVERLVAHAEAYAGLKLRSFVTCLLDDLLALRELLRPAKRATRRRKKGTRR